MNKTIIERARSMRLHVGFPLQLWVDVVDIVVYLINRGPSSSLDGRIPEEEWTGKRLKCLRSDNGGEYCNKEFDNYFSYHGIRREKIVPGTPQENGVSERMNTTIMENAMSMRLHVGLPLQF